MPDFLLITLIVLCALLLVGMTVLSITVGRLRKTLAGLDGRITKVQQTVSAQEAQLRRITDLMDKQKQDPLSGILDALSQWRKKGAAATLGLVLSRVIASYWKGRGSKALPSKKKTEDYE